MCALVGGLKLESRMVRLLLFDVVVDDDDNGRGRMVPLWWGSVQRTRKGSLDDWKAVRLRVKNSSRGLELGVGDMMGEVVKSAYYRMRV